MTLLFKVEDVFDISGRGCVLAPQIFTTVDVKVREKDQLQLRTPDGKVLDTHIASIELGKPQLGGHCRAFIMLPRELDKKDIPIGTEVWLL
jgi:translation elongation factor EF-Tu-like GTPase